MYLSQLYSLAAWIEQFHMAVDCSSFDKKKSTWTKTKLKIRNLFQSSSFFRIPSEAYPFNSSSAVLTILLDNPLTAAECRKDLLWMFITGRGGSHISYMLNTNPPPCGAAIE
jgi:hypothetical protein